MTEGDVGPREGWPRVYPNRHTVQDETARLLSEKTGLCLALSSRIGSVRIGGFFSIELCVNGVKSGVQFLGSTLYGGDTLRLIWVQIIRCISWFAGWD